LFPLAPVGHSCWGISTVIKELALGAFVARGAHATCTIMRILEASKVAYGAGCASHCKKEVSVEKDHLSSTDLYFFYYYYSFYFFS
jgi:hypothetical protein